MAADMKQCSSYRPGPHFCRDGFPQSSACAGYVCHACGRPTDTLPACMREDLGKHLIDEQGRPLYGPFAYAERASRLRDHKEPPHDRT